MELCEYPAANVLEPFSRGKAPSGTAFHGLHLRQWVRPLGGQTICLKAVDVHEKSPKESEILKLTLGIKTATVGYEGIL
jgi:hypothetical protein